MPTLTELYYHDPANLGSPDLRAERGWSADGGIDVTSGGWMFSASPFIRWDQDVIDWVRATPSDLWRSTNVRDVTTQGVEVSASRRWRDALVRASYSRLFVDAPALRLQSKYVLEYARHSVGVAIAAPIGQGFRGSLSVDGRARLDGQRYTLVGAKLSRAVGRAGLFVEATNLLDVTYHEVAGVSMPGRWALAGITLR
jgi:iron complex outermembrane receptor protein